jgi:predicted nucleic acid-binding protein
VTIVVLDGSSALAWCFEDETTTAVRRLFAEVEQGGALVPPVFPFEVANGLIVGERRGRVRPDSIAGLLNALRALPIRVDRWDDPDLHATTIELARREKLSVYDASYLALAIRRELPLATLDRALLAASRRCGVATFPLLDS